MECPLPRKKKQNVNYLLLLQLNSLAFIFRFVLKFGDSLNFNSENIFRMKVIKFPIKNDEDYFHWVLIGILPRNYSKMPNAQTNAIEKCTHYTLLPQRIL